MNLEQEIRDFIKNEVKAANRPDLFREPIIGFSAADDPRYEKLKTIIGDWVQMPKDFLPDAKTVISYFVPFTKEVAKSPQGDGAQKLWGEAYKELNKVLNLVGEQVVTFLKERDYNAGDFAATYTFDPKVLHSPWSHRSAAVISGLGTFGLNRMVITDRGSAGRFCTVFTSAKIAPSPMTKEEYCIYQKDGKCGACVKNCPANALQPGNWLPFDCYDICLKNAETLKDEVGFADVCGKCIGVCPRRYMD